MSVEPKLFSVQDTSSILTALHNDGMCLANDFISQDDLAELQEYLEIRFSLRRTTDIRNGFIKSGNHKFLSYTMLAPHSINIYTNKSLMTIADTYCGDSCHISNHRIFQNTEIAPLLGKPMHWHKDNKVDYIDQYGTHTTKMIEEDKGLIMIMYLSDVSKGGTQFIPGSHLYQNGTESFDPSEISQFENVTLNNINAGTAVLYDYRTIHRAQPFYRKRYRRTALFSQMSPSFMPKGEPIAVAADALFRLDAQQRKYLGFDGNTPTAPNWPIDKIN